MLSGRLKLLSYLVGSSSGLLLLLLLLEAMLSAFDNQTGTGKVAGFRDVARREEETRKEKANVSQKMQKKKGKTSQDEMMR